MKRGSKFPIKLADLVDDEERKAELADRQVEVEWCGKAKALAWNREAQRIQLEDHRELHELREKYPAEVAPELHERDEEGNLTVQAPGALERQHGLAMLVLEPTIGRDIAEDIFDEDPILCFSLAVEVMGRHRLDAKLPLS